MEKTATVELDVLIEASRKSVFDAWTDPKVVAKWFPVVAGAQTASGKSENRSGGAYRYTMSFDDLDQLVMHGTYLELNDPESLVMSMTFEPLDGYDTFPHSQVKVTFEEFPSRTKVLLSQDGLFDRMAASVSKEWLRALGRLQNHLAKSA